MAQTKVEFKGIHNSLKIAVQRMEIIFSMTNFESVDEHITAVKEAIMLAEATMDYVRNNKPKAEKNPEGLADKLAEQMDGAEQLLEYLERWQTLIENEKLLDYANSDEEPFEERIAALTEILDVTQDSYIGNVVDIDQANNLALQRNKAEHLIEVLSIEEDHTLKALQEENDALLAEVEQERVIMEGVVDNFLSIHDENSEINKIDMALSMLQSQIIFIGKNVECAQDVAEILYNDLLTARDQYYSSLKNGTDENGEQISRTEARQLFKATCDGLIMEAMPILEKDHLSWGDFLQNLMKTIANAVIKVGSLFTVHNFFTPVKSTKEIITEAGNELQDVDPQFTI